MLTAECRIFGRSMHSQTALRSQWDKGGKNNLRFASPSIRRPTFGHPQFKTGGGIFQRRQETDTKVLIHAGGDRAGP